MTKLGIVGSEEIKFSPAAAIEAKALIRMLLDDSNITEVVSGGCHLGGIDTWAAQIGKELGKKVTEFLPKTRKWDGGYKERNLQIAAHSDVVYCITVNDLPETYTGMRFKLCYHCKTDTHVKSGGCWTVNQAKKMGKEAHVRVIRQYQ